MSVAEIVDAVDVGQSTVCTTSRSSATCGFLLVEREDTSSWWRINENCLGCFPTAAELVMGRAPARAMGALTCVRTEADERRRAMTTTRSASTTRYATTTRAAARPPAPGTSPVADQTRRVRRRQLRRPRRPARCGRAGQHRMRQPHRRRRSARRRLVLDLGSGGGIDVLLSARRVGPTGFAYGLDMTPEMLDLARRNAAEGGRDQRRVPRGHIEAIPLPDASVDVVISNCVINLSPDKPAVFAEMFRVLRAGRRIGISDVVTEDRLTDAERAERGSSSAASPARCPSASTRTACEAAGFVDVSITFTNAVADGVHSAIVKATKPAPESPWRLRRRDAGTRPSALRPGPDLVRTDHGLDVAPAGSSSRQSS